MDVWHFLIAGYFGRSDVYNRFHAASVPRLNFSG